MATTYSLTLLPQHVALLEASAISAEVAEARDYRSITTMAELERLGFSRSQRSVPGLLLPVYNVIGEQSTYQYRPDRPRIGDKGRPVKYETRVGSRMVIDVSPIARPLLANNRLPLFITEGTRKADAAVSIGLCSIALLGVWNWRGTNEFGGKTALSDWELIALNEREAYIVFDSDVMTKPEVHQALIRLKGFLELRGVDVNLIYLPPGQGATKVGLDDYLVSGNTVSQLLTLASPNVHTFPEELGVSPSYKVQDGGLVWERQTQNGLASFPLTNFVAKIVGDVREEDGADERRSFEIEAKIGD